MNQNMKKFETIKEEIEYYILELLSAGKEFARSEINKHVTQSSGKEVKDGTFSGVLSKLVKNNPSIISPRRGYYQFIKQENEDSIQKIIEVTKKEFMNDFNELTKKTEENFIKRIHVLPAGLQEMPLYKLMEQIKTPDVINNQEKDNQIEEDDIKILKDFIARIKINKNK